MSTQLDKLFEDAAADGLSQASVSIMVENLNALTIAGAEGTSIDELAGDEVTLFCAIIDETGSMDLHKPTVIAAYNQMLQALKQSAKADSILLSTWFFNTHPRLIHSYLPLDDVPKLTPANYNPDDLTALFDATLYGLTSVTAYGQDLRNNGVRTKVVVVVFTDGEDNQSMRSAGEVGQVTADLIKQEFYHLALVAFGTGFAQDAAYAMGFPNVLEVGATDADIRSAVGAVSESVIKVSQSKIGTSKSGGFFS